MGCAHTFLGASHLDAQLQSHLEELEAKVPKVKPGSSYMGPCTHKLTICSVIFDLSRPGERMEGGFLLDSGRCWARTV